MFRFFVGLLAVIASALPYMDETAGPTAPPFNSAERNASVVKVGIPHPLLLSSAKSMAKNFLSQPTWSNWTFKYYYTEVLGAIDLIN